MSARNPFLTSRAEPVKATGSLRLHLNDAAECLYIEKGRVDLFYVLGDPDRSRLNHLARFEEGECLFGLVPPPGSGLNLVVTGSGETRLLRLPLEALREACHDGEQREWVARRLDHWLEKIAANVFPDEVPKTHQQLTGGEEITCRGDELLLPKKHVLWAKIHRGQASVGDMIPVNQASGFLPLTHGMFLIPEAESRIAFLKTETYLEAEPDWEGLQRFHGMVFQVVVFHHQRNEGEERERLQKKLENDRSLMKRAVLGFADVLRKASSREEALTTTVNPLYQAFMLVARAQRINFPGKLLDQARGASDSLDDLTLAVGIYKRLVILSDRWWRQDNGPLLGVVKGTKQPVALLPDGPGRYRMVNPATGARAAIDETLAATLRPRAYMLYRPLPNKPLSIRDLLSFGSGDIARDLLVIALLGGAAGLLGLVIPYATGMVFDQAIPKSSRATLAFLALGLLVTALVTALYSITRGFAMLRMEGRLDTLLQGAIWDRIMRLPVPFFREYSSGDLVVRAMGIDQMRRMVTGSVASSLISSIFSVFYFFQLFYYSWGMALLGAGLSLVALAPLVLVVLKIRLERQIANLEGKLSSMVLQIIHGIAKLRVSGSEIRAFARWAQPFGEKKKLAFKAGLIESFTMVWNSVFSIFSMIAIFSFMMYLVDEGKGLSLGAFLAFNAAFSLFLAGVLDFSNTLVSLLKLVPIYERAKPILQTMPEEDENTTPPGVLKGRIEVSNLRFRYHEDGPLILRDVSIKVEPDEFVAIIGPSGSGKSTLFRLLLGFEKPGAGAIYYDNRDLSGLSIKAVRRQIGVVLQNGRLVPGSLFQNIVGSLPLTEADAWEAAAMAGFDQDIKEMPMGMHTLIGESGGTLSGGQVQRMLIARALANKPKILFFDEATSALDNQTQAVVSRGLDRLRVTRLVIAHRLSTIVNADRILVLDKGRLVQNGTYQELMQREGIFRELARRQIA